MSTTNAAEMESLKSRLKTTWMAGNYDYFSRFMESGPKEIAMARKASLVAERQTPLRRTYVEDPERARTVKWAATVRSAETDALHSVVHIGKGYGVSLRTGIDHAVGGNHDLPNPGDLLCAALAVCKDGSIRMIADLLGIPIVDLQVEVTGDVDVRGCLAIDRAVKVGFRLMTCRVHLRVPSDIDPGRIATLQKQAEQSCVNLDSLRSGVPVDLVFNVESVASGMGVDR